MRKLLVGFLLGLIALSAAAADLLSTVQQRGSLRIGLEGVYPPFNFKEKGRLTGFEVELATLLARKMGVKAEFSTAEWSALLAGLQTGKYDVILNQVTITPPREQAFDFSTPYTLSSAQIIERSKDGSRFRRLTDLKGHVVGVNQGTNYQQLLLNTGGITVKTYPGAQEVLSDLASGRIDAALNDSLMLPFLLKRTRLPLHAGASVGPVNRMGIPFVKGNPQFKAALNQALTDIIRDGSFKALSTKWFGIDVSQAPSSVN